LPQARVSRAAIRVQDSEIGRSARWRVSIAQHLGSGQLADDVPPELDPGPPLELELQPGHRFDRRGDRSGQTRRLEHDQLDLGSPGHRREPVNSVGRSGRAAGAISAAGAGSAAIRTFRTFRTFRGFDRQTAFRRQVQQQDIHRSVLEEHRRDRERLVQRLRREHDEPLELNASRRRFDRIQAAREIQIGRDAAGRLGLRDRLEGQRGLAAGAVALERYGCRPGQTAQTENGVQRTKAGGDDPLVRRPKRRPKRLVGTLLEFRSDRERAPDLRSKLRSIRRSQISAPSRSRLAEASAERLKSGLDLRGSGGHGRSIVEQTF